MLQFLSGDGAEDFALASTPILEGLARCEPQDADPASVARAIVGIVDTPHGKRPLRVHVDPSQDGAEVVNVVADRIRAEFLRRIGLESLLAPASN